MLSYIAYVAIGLIGISMMLLIHELGHFIAARLLKVDVELFSIGMGPKLISFFGRTTEYRISLIPFGGYCRMKGSTDLAKAISDKSDRIVSEKHSYFAASPAIRFLIYLSGPLASFLTALLFFSVSLCIPVDHLSDPAIAVPCADYGNVFPGMPRQSAIEKGDRIISADGIDVADWQDFERIAKGKNGEDLSLMIERDGEIMPVTLKSLEYNGESTYSIALLKKPVIGRSESDLFQEGDEIIAVNSIPIDSTYDIFTLSLPFDITIRRNGEERSIRIMTSSLPFAWKSSMRRYRDSDHPIKDGFGKVIALSESILKSLGALLSFQFGEITRLLTGPVKAAESIGRISTLAFSQSSFSGIRSSLILLAIVSTSIAIGNILPIPSFDGGQMLICIAEAIHGKGLKPRTYLHLQLFGIAAALVIMVSMYWLDFLDILGI